MISQVSDKHISAKLCLACWSPSVDLLALASTTGVIMLYRMNLTRLWSRNPPAAAVHPPVTKSCVTVISLEWRPDGKLLSVAYSTGIVIHLCVENDYVLHQLELSADITCIKWASLSDSYQAPTCEWDLQPTIDTLFAERTYALQPLKQKYTDGTVQQQHQEVAAGGHMDAGCVGRHLLAVTGVFAEEGSPDTHFPLLVFLVGSKAGVVDVYMHGVFHARTCLICSDTPLAVQSLSVSPDLHFVSAIACTKDRRYIIKQFSPRLFERLCARQWRHLLLVYIRLIECKLHVRRVMEHLCAAWDPSLREFDLSLDRYQKTHHRTESLNNHFASLLLLGCASSPHFEQFLVTQVGAKTLDKITRTLTMNCSALANSLDSVLHPAIMASLECLVQLETLSLTSVDISGVTSGRISGEENRLCVVSAVGVRAAIHRCSLLLIKCHQLRQMMPESYASIRVFLRWLLHSVCKISDEAIPAAIDDCEEPIDPSQNIDQIVAFLRANFGSDSFTSDTASLSSCCVLDRIGCYLRDEPLPVRQHDSSAEDIRHSKWYKFLSAHCEKFGNIKDSISGMLPAICDTYTSDDRVQSLLQAHNSFCSVCLRVNNVIDVSDSVHTHCADVWADLTHGAPNHSRVMAPETRQSFDVTPTLLIGANYVTGNTHTLRVLCAHSHSIHAFHYSPLPTTTAPVHCSLDVFHPAHPVCGDWHISHISQLSAATYCYCMHRVSAVSDAISQVHLGSVSAADGEQLTHGWSEPVEGTAGVQLLAVNGARGLAALAYSAGSRVRVYDLSAAEEDDVSDC